MCHKSRNKLERKVWREIKQLIQEIDEEKRKQRYILFSGLQKSLWTVSAAVKLKDARSLEGKR